MFRGNLKGLSRAFGNLQANGAGMITIKKTLKANSLNGVS